MRGKIGRPEASGKKWAAQKEAEGDVVVAVEQWVVTILVLGAPAGGHWRAAGWRLAGVWR